MDIKIERCIDSLICDGYDLDDITLAFIKTLHIYQDNLTKINEPKISDCETNINSLPKDVLVHMLLNSNISDVVSLCKSSKYIYEKVYMNETFWQKKIKLDFPDHKPYNYWSDPIKPPTISYDMGHRKAYIINYNLAKQCKYVFMRGNKKGLKCGYPKANFQSSNNIKGGDEYCKQCLKKKVVQIRIKNNHP